MERMHQRGGFLARAATVAASTVTAALAALAGAGCPQPMTPGVELTLRFETTVGGDALAGGDPAYLPGDVRIDEAVLSVARTTIGGDGDDVTEDEAFAVDLFDAPAAGRAIDGAPPALYSRVGLRLAPSDTVPYAVHVRGAAGAVPFDYAAADPCEPDIRLVEGLALDAGESGTFRVRADLARWFMGVDLATGEVDKDGVIRVDAENNAALGEMLAAALCADEGGTLSVEAW